MQRISAGRRSLRKCKRIWFACGESGSERTTQCRRSQTLAHDAENHGELVDDELGPAHVIFVVPHVTVLELGPLNLAEIEAPYYCHIDGRRVCGV